MSTTIDSKVVEMQFDNAQFERGVQTSLSTLDKLKAALNFDGVGDALNNLGGYGIRRNLFRLGESADYVSSRFSALEVIGITALANITNSVVNASKQFVKSLSFDNIAAGWSKFGEKTSSVATLTAQGYALETVNEQLDKLNWFTDETSYNFTDMTSNIAKFTASGQSLEDSVIAMQGIANWAALSGQNATVASRAMYQLSQAMGAGVMRREDYRSIQNVSMDTQEFRQHAIDAAIALGTLQKNADGTYHSIAEGAKKVEDFSIDQFAEQLTNGAWFTSDVMMRVYKEYSSAVEPIYEFTEEYDLLASQVLEAKHAYDEGGKSFETYIEKLDLSEEGEKELEKLVSGLDDFGVKALEAAQQARTWADVVDSVKDAVSTKWMNVFQQIFGDKDQATKLFTDMSEELYNVFAEPIDKLGYFLKDTLGAESAAFSKIKDDTKDLTGRGVLLEGFTNLWNNLLGAMDLVGKSWRAVFPETSAEQMYQAIERFRDFTASLTLSEEATDRLSRTLEGIFSIFDVIRKVAGIIGGAVVPELVSGFSNLAMRVLGATGNFGDWIKNLDGSIEKSELLHTIAEKLASGIHAGFEQINKMLDIAGPKVAEIADKVGPKIQSLITRISGIIDFMTPRVIAFIDTIRENFTTPGFEAFTALAATLSKYIEATGARIIAFKNTIVNVLNNIKTAIQNSGFIDAIKNLFSLVISVGGQVFGILGSGLQKVFAAIANLKISDISNIVNILFNVLKSVLGIKAGIKLGKVFGDFSSMFTSLGETAKGIKAIPDLFKNLGDVFAEYQKKLKTDQLKSIAVSLAILAASLFVLSTIEPDRLSGATMAIVGLMTGLGAFAYMLSSKLDITKLAIAAKAAPMLIEMSAAVLILAAALKVVSTIETDKLLNSVLALGGIMAELLVFSVLLDSLYDSTAKGMIGMIAMAAAVKILAGACKTLAAIDEDGLLRGVIAVGILLAELSLVSLLSSDASHMIATGVGLTFMAIAVKVLASAVKSFGKLSWEDIGKGLLAMAGALIAVTAAVNLMPVKILAIGPALIAVSGAMLMLAGVLRILGGMKWESIGKGLAALGGAILIAAIGVNAMKGAILGVVALVAFAGALAILVPELMLLGSMSIDSILRSLIAIAGVFAVLGVAAVGLKFFLDDITNLAKSLAIMGAALIVAGLGFTALGVGLGVLAVGIMAFSESVSIGAVALVTAFVAIMVKITQLLPSLAIAVAKSLTEFIVTFFSGGSRIMDALSKFLDAGIPTIIEIVTKHIPALVEAVIKFFITALDGLIKYGPLIVEKLVKFFQVVFTSLGKAFSNLNPVAIINAIKNLGIVLAFVAALALIGGLIPGAMSSLIALGGLVAELSAVLAVFGLINQIPGLAWFVSEGGDFAALIGEQIGKFVGSIVGGIAEGVASKLPAIGSSLSGFMEEAEPFFLSVSSIGRDTFGAVGDLASAILTLTASDLIGGIAGWVTGASSVKKFSRSLPILATGMATYAAIISTAPLDSKQIESSRVLATMLADFAAHNVPKSGGLIQLIMGNSSLSNFGSQLKILALGLRDYADVISGAVFSDEKIDASKRLAIMLSDLANTNIPKYGGLLSLSEGQSRLDKFGEQLTPLALGLTDYANQINGAVFNAEKIEASRQLISMLGTLASADIPKTGGLLGLLEGNSSLSSWSSQLPYLAKAFTEYADDLGDSILDRQKIAASKWLMKTLLEFSNDSLPKFDTSLSSMRTELPTLASSLTTYTDNLGDSILDRRKVVASKRVVEILTELSSVDIPPQKGVLQMLAGGQDLSVFGSKLPDLASGLSAYADTIAGSENLQKADIIDASTNLAATLGALASNTIPETGGVLGWLFGGTKDLSSFSTQLPYLAEGITGYAKNLGSELVDDDGKVDASKKVVEMLTTLATDIPTNKGFLGKLFGGDDLSSFAKQLPILGAALTDYAKSLGTELDSDAIDRADQVARMLIALQNSVSGQNNGGIFVSGDLSQFGINIRQFGAGLVEYCNYIIATEPEKVKETSEKLVEAIGVLATADISGLNTFVTTLKDSGKDITDAAKSLGSSFGKGINSGESKESIASSAGTLVSSVTSAISKRTKDVIDAGTSIGTNLAEGLTLGVKDIPSNMESLIDSLVSEITGKNDDFKSAGDGVAHHLESGLGSKNDNIKNAFSGPLSGAVSKVRDYRSDFYKAGNYLVEGFANGISENTWKAAAKSAAMARAAEKAANEELKNGSPSKEFFKIGSFAGQGFVNGLSAYADVAYSASSKMAASAKDGIGLAIADITDALSGNMEYRPTIRPVVDLDDIRAGANAMDNIFNRDYTFGSLNNTSVLESRMSNRSSVVTNGDVVSAIKSLEKKLDDIPGDTYNVNGITYDDGSNISSAVRTLIRAAIVEGRA